MGVRGLTTFIKNHEKKYLKDYKLHNSTVILDGNSIAANLFIGSNTESAFGGDYDKFAKYVKEFFKGLIKCEIKPLVLFDGGYEERKLKTVYSRLKDKFRTSHRAQPLSGSMNFPLFLRIVFREVLTEMNIPFAQSDFEADDEIAALARQLDCPVLSYDSDFYIYDVLYIPFPSLCLDPIAFDASKTTFYLQCKIYKVDVFIESFGGLDKSMLPLLAALLGNDYIKRSVFNAFYRNLKIPKGKTNPLQRRIRGVIDWLRKESFESAVRKILGRMKQRTRRGVIRKLKKIVNGYVQCSSVLGEHLAITSINESTTTTSKESAVPIVSIIEHIDENIESICDDNDGVESEEAEESASVSSSSEESEEDIVEEDNVMKDDKSDHIQCDEDIAVTSNNFYPDWLMQYARKGKIQSCVIDIITLRQHFFIPQVEDSSLPSAHLVCLKTFSAIVGLLLGSSKPHVKYWTREGLRLRRYPIEPMIETASLRFPPSADITLINESTRRLVLLEITETAAIDLSKLPDEWHLFVISVIVWLKNMKQPLATESHLHAIVMCIVCIYTIDLHIGMHRNRQSFMRKYKNYLRKIEETENKLKETLKESNELQKPQCSINEMNDPKTAFGNVTHKDCVVMFESILPHHHLCEQIKSNPKVFCLSTVHSFAQFQSCLFHVIVLNSVLCFPFKETVVSKLFSGTFVYNMFINLSRRTNVDAYVETLFHSCPSLLVLYKALVNFIQSALSEVDLSRNPVNKKRKKKRQPKRVQTDMIVIEKEENEESFMDENNMFSTLSIGVC